MYSGPRLILALALALALAVGIGSPGAAQAASDVDDSPQITVQVAKAQSAAQGTWGACPCVRWTFEFQAAAGQIETKTFLISTEGLLKFRQSTNPSFLLAAQRIFKIGAAEALVKGAHLGLGFRGLTVGDDYDQGYTSMVRTGVYGILNLLLHEVARLDLRTAYDWERMRINDDGQGGVEPYARGLLDESAVFRWAAGRFSGDILAHVGTDASHAFDPQYLRAGASASTRLSVIRSRGFRGGVGLGGGFEHDAFQELFGLPADSFKALLTVDVSYTRGAPESERTGW